MENFFKESNKKISDEMKHDLNELQSKLESERDRVGHCTKEKLC